MTTRGPSVWVRGGRRFAPAGRRVMSPPRSIVLLFLLPLVAAGQGVPGGRAEVEAVAAPEPADWHELLRLDDDMRRFFSARVAFNAAESEQIDAIVAAVLEPAGLGFTYRDDATWSARETFRRREGNCVAFSILVVAVAREFGLVARFNEVRTEPQWDRVGQVVAEYRHLNVVVRTETGRVMVDLLPAPGAGGPLTVARPVSDAQAFAMFYSNVGVQLLGHGRIAESRAYLERATQIAPRYAAAWVNLGNWHSLAGDRAAARACYEQALRVDRYELKALAGLAAIHRAEGDTARAAALERRAARYLARNPYYQGDQARRAFTAGDFAEAERLARRALALKGDEPEFLELAIGAARKLGHARDAARWERRLDELRAAARDQTGSTPPGP